MGTSNSCPPHALIICGIVFTHKNSTTQCQAFIFSYECSFSSTLLHHPAMSYNIWCMTVVNFAISLSRAHTLSLPLMHSHFVGLMHWIFFSIATHCIFLNEFKKILVQISFQFLILGCSSHINPLIPYKCISKIELTRHGRHIIFSNIILKRVVFHLRFFIYTFKLRYF
jgi:hypothetical protein